MGMKWKDFEELMDWANDNYINYSSYEKSHPIRKYVRNYWLGYYEALECIATNVFPREYFVKLMDRFNHKESEEN